MTKILRKKCEIEKWLKKYNIKNYELIEDKEYGYIVNVNSDVNLFNKNIHEFEVKFNEVKGFFNCSYNQLTSLEGCPEIIGGNLYCDSNLLTMEGLKYLPKEIKNNYIQIINNPDLGNLQYIFNFLEVYLYSQSINSKELINKNINLTIKKKKVNKI